MLKPSESFSFKVKAVNNAELAVGHHYRAKVKAMGRLEGNDVSSAELSAAKVTVVETADANIVTNAANTAKNKVVLPGVAEEVLTFNYNVKNDSVDVSKLTLDTANLVLTDIESVEVCFDNICPADTFEYSAQDKLDVKFLNLLTLEPKNYNVRVNVNFAEGAIVSPEYFYADLETALTSDGNVANNTTAEKAAAQADSKYISLKAVVDAVESIDTTNDTKLNAAISAVETHKANLLPSTYIALKDALKSDGNADNNLDVEKAKAQALDRYVVMKSIRDKVEGIADGDANKTLGEALDAVKASRARVQTVKRFTGVELGGKKGTFSYSHWVARSYPFLAVKEKNTNT